jgi:hypothetical protein
MQDKSDPVLEQCLSDALRRFDANLEAALPRTTPNIRQYLRGVPTKPEHVFGVRNFPHFLKLGVGRPLRIGAKPVGQPMLSHMRIA